MKNGCELRLQAIFELLLELNEAKGLRQNDASGKLEKTSVF